MSSIFFLMFIYQKFTSLEGAVYTVKERAATWDNSFRDLETGSRGESFRTDGLYWRIIADYSGSDLVSQKQKNANVFARSKLGYGRLSYFPEEDEITTKYVNRVINRTVSVDVGQDIQASYPGLSKLLGTSIFSSASADIAEPVEFIRTYELANEYFSQLLGYLQSFGQNIPLPPEVQVFASSKSDVYGQKVYHFAGCRYIARIKKENLKTFTNEDEAVSQGYHLCIVCAKRVLPK